MLAKSFLHNANWFAFNLIELINFKTSTWFSSKGFEWTYLFVIQTKLVESMREKINELRDQEQEIGEEIRVNEDLGKKVRNMVESKATQSEFSKFELFIGELNKIVALLLSLTQRLHRYESMLQDLDMSNEADRAKKVCQNCSTRGNFKPKLCPAFRWCPSLNYFLSENFFYQKCYERKACLN